MIKKFEDMNTVLNKEMRGGKGQATVLNILQDEEKSENCKMFARVKLEPGSSIGYHKHTGDDEVYYILSGIGEINDNGNISLLRAGDVVKTCSGESHSIKNNGKELLEFLAVVFLTK